MDIKFNSYEFLGVIAPGAVSLSGAFFIFPAAKNYLITSSGNLGSLGIFLVFAYIAGQLVGAIGNILESIWWLPKGMPTEWVRSEQQELLAGEQRNKLRNRLHEKYPRAQQLSKISDKDWKAFVRELNIEVIRDGNTKRIDTFNRNYGLMRGISASFLSFAALYALGTQSYDINVIIFISCCLGTSLYRMHRFAKRYARELLLEYIALPIAPPIEIPQEDYIQNVG